MIALVHNIVSCCRSQVFTGCHHVPTSLLKYLTSRQYYPCTYRTDASSTAYYHNARSFHTLLTHPTEEARSSHHHHTQIHTHSRRLPQYLLQSLIATCSSLFLMHHYQQQQHRPHQLLPMYPDWLGPTTCIHRV